VLGAYNEFYKYIDPVSNDTLYLLGFEANIAGGGHLIWNGYYKGALFAKRYTDGQYSIEEINGTIGLNDNALVANRCYVKSPFSNENALYFGGFDPNSNSSTNMAWVFKKDYQNTSVSEMPTTKQTVRIVDILGRETKEIKNTLLFYIYNDGSVEKRIIIK